VPDKCIYFLKIVKFAIFLVQIYIVVGGEEYSRWLLYICLLYSSLSFHQEHATKPLRLHKDIAALCGAVILCFHGISNLYELLICGLQGLVTSHRST